MPLFSFEGRAPVVSPGACAEAFIGNASTVLDGAVVGSLARRHAEGVRLAD